ncbi:MAG: family 43 glycosylhydrolase [Firmicutes bacterium]|nr:family 43 glycosylhydrolase [Bacillota bacterium]
MAISKEKMQEIYEKIKTPYKYGAVIKSDEYLTDSPSVFRYNGKWYMYYIMIHKNVENSGYETHLASSDDLINWNYEGKLFERIENGHWDSRQIAGYAAFVDNDFGGKSEIKSVNGKYYMAYLGGNLNGYETDPLSMGLAYANSPIGKFIRFEKPILSPKDADSREFETLTLYKSDMFIDEAMTLGHKYVNAYNAKPLDNKERIYLAVSDDGERWKRYLDKPIIDETKTIPNLLISGDPQIVKIDDLYVMFFFRSIENGGAYNTFAVSENLTDWTIWDGEPLIKPEYDWENVFAHKSCVVKDSGIVYHYYCAVNDKGERFIALATSEEI